MRVPLSWLAEFVPLEMPLETLAERLSVTSAEVEGIERRGVPDDGGNLGFFRVGRVVEAAKHPNADRLQLCVVDVGDGAPLQIVCGAWNFDVGATVGVGLTGAVLSSGLRLERREVRGQTSEGMILAEDEVGLGAEHSGIMLLPDGVEPGTPLADVLPLVDDVLVLEATGNRSDLFSMYGVAREVAALFDLDLGPMPGADPKRGGFEMVEVQVDDLVACPRYIGRLFHDVRLGPAPMWMRARLHAAGMRPISNVVDVTNYAMLALGSPLHAFDFATLRGGRIVVRRGREGEELRTLDGVLRTVGPDELLIADGERAIALAGIMGGEETEIGEATTDVLLEAANFEPTGIYRTSERLRLRTESSNRWEKGVDPHLTADAASLATELLVDHAGAVWTGHGEVVGDLPERPVVRFRPERADALIGISTPEERQHELLARLGFESRDGEVVSPTWRARDVTREVDVIEEVARFRLEDVPFTLPTRRAMFGGLTPAQALRRRVEDVLAGMGFSETYTPSLRPDDPDDEALRLPEPISVDVAVLRTSLLPSLVEAARRNVEAGNDRVALFEIARVYLPAGPGLPREQVHVAAILEGPFPRVKGAFEALYRALKAEATFARAEHPLFHPGKTARLDGGLVGELHPILLEGVWSGFELDLDGLLAAQRGPVRYEDVITYPANRQDIAVAVLDEVEAGAMVNAVREAGGELLREVRVFDVYRGDQVGEGRKSVALHLVFQSPDRTITDVEATALRERIVAALADGFGAELRA